MSSKDFDHVTCPRCERKLVVINISAQPDYLGMVVGFCPVHFMVFCTEHIDEDDPFVKPAKFRKTMPISADLTFKTYETLLLANDQLISFIDAVWERGGVTDSCLQLIYTFKRQLVSLNEILRRRMDHLNKYRKEE